MRDYAPIYGASRCGSPLIKRSGSSLHTVVPDRIPVERYDGLYLPVLSSHNAINPYLNNYLFLKCTDASSSSVLNSMCSFRVNKKRARTGLNSDTDSIYTIEAIEKRLLAQAHVFLFTL